MMLSSDHTAAWKIMKMEKKYASKSLNENGKKSQIFL